MRSIADGELAVNKTFADEMSYCLRCLGVSDGWRPCRACGTPPRCFRRRVRRVEKPRSCRRLRRVFFVRWLTLKFLFTNPARLRFVGRLLRLVQEVPAWMCWLGISGLTRFLPADLQRLQPQAPRISPAFSERVDCGKRGACGWWRLEPAGGVADWVCAGPRVFGYRSGYGGRAIGEWMSGAYSAGTALLRVFAQPQRGARNWRVYLARRMIDLLPPDEFDAVITRTQAAADLSLRHYSGLLKDDPHLCRKGASLGQ